MPRSAIIWTRSRELSLNVRYHRTHRTIISWSKCRPLKSSCAEAGSVIQAATAGSRAFQVCTRTVADVEQSVAACKRLGRGILGIEERLQRPLEVGFDIVASARLTHGRFEPALEQTKKDIHRKSFRKQTGEIMPGTPK